MMDMIVEMPITVHEGRRTTSPLPICTPVVKTTVFKNQTCLQVIFGALHLGIGVNREERKIILFRKVSKVRCTCILISTGWPAPIQGGSKPAQIARCLPAHVELTGVPVKGTPVLINS